MYGISDNGRFAVVSDTSNGIAWLWDSTNPDVFTDISFDVSKTQGLPSGQRVKQTSACDVTDDGIVVGSLIYADGRWRPAYYANGEWTVLPMINNALNTNEAIAVTPDGKTIAGYNYVPAENEIKGGYVPVQWTLQEDGTYKLVEFTEASAEILAYEHQGFYPLAQSKNGRVITGQLYCGASSIIPALVVDGKLKVFDKVTVEEEPFVFQGKYYCGTDKDGKQIWTTDPDDPRIVLFPEYYINGLKDTAESNIQSYLNNCSGSRYFYGNYARITADENGEGTVNVVAAVYDLEKDEWTYDADCGFYCAGVGKDLIFADTNTVIVNGEKRQTQTEYEINPPSTFAGINRCSENGGVLGGMYYEVNPSNGENDYFPLITVTGNTFNGIDQVYGGNNVSFLVSNGTVSVRNADSMTVYSINGAVVAEGVSASLEPGIYIVKAAGKTAKIQIR